MLINFGFVFCHQQMSKVCTAVGRSHFTVADYLMERLAQIGIKDMFAVVGDCSLAFLQHAERSRVRVIACCNELNASYAADGYARTHGLGAISTTYLVGSLSAINGIAGAFAENVPVLIIDGWPSNEEYKKQSPLHHTIKDYDIPVKMFSLVTEAQTVLRNPEIALSEIDRVLTVLQFHRRPVYIGIPANVVGSPCDRPSRALAHPERFQACPEAFESVMQELLVAIHSAQSPVVVADFEIDRFRLQEPLEKMIHKTRLPFATCIMGKGVLSEDTPGFLGVYQGNRSEMGVRKRVESSDCILLLGHKITDFNSGGFTELFPEEKTISINMNRIKIYNRAYENVHLPYVLEYLAQHVRPHWKKEAIKRPKTYQRPTKSKLTVKRLFQIASHLMLPQSIVICETGSALFEGVHMSLSHDTTFMSQTFFSSIGWTVGACLGAALRYPGKTYLFVGDGSFQLTAQELSTMIRYHTQPIIILLNNDGYLVERLIGDGEFNDLQPWKYADLINVFGAQNKSYKVQTEQEFADALQQAQESETLQFIEVILDRWDAPKTMIQAAQSMAKNDYVPNAFTKKHGFGSDFDVNYQI